MIFKTNIQFVFIISILFIGCNDIEKNETVSEKQEIENNKINLQEKTTLKKEPSVEIGFCTINNLRIRKTPYLTSETLSQLTSNEKVEILERSSWTEEINQINDYWLKIKSKDFTGWVFGGYINYNKSSIELIKISNLEPDFQTIMNFKRIDDLSSYPLLTMRNLGFEIPREIPKVKDTKIIYNNMNSELLLINYKQPRLSIRIIATDPTGDHTFVQNFKDSDFYMIDSDEYGNKIEGMTALSVPFHNLSFFKKGEWFFTVIVDEETEYPPVTTKIKPGIVSIYKNPIPSPFMESGSFNARYTQKFYICGNSDYIETNIDFVLYRIDYKSQNDDSSFNLFPELAADCITDINGQFILEIEPGSDITSGHYKIAFGKTITGVIEFDTSLEIK
ncbi:MAG: SH3 domain-containing protein [bacterium]|nr:SH3 domain-containing protein [bacterium]